MSRRAIILANGEIDEPAVVQARLADWAGASVIAADGGSRHAAALGLRLDAVVGDLDSLDPRLHSRLGKTGAHLEIVPARKDETDLELALLYAARQGARHVALLGALGGRLDMTLANILLLLHPGLDDVRVEIWAVRQTAWLIRPPGEDIPGQPGDTLSLIPLMGDADGITTHGLEYPLRGEPLFQGTARGVSNVLADTTAHVELRRGALLAVHTPGRA